METTAGREFCRRGGLMERLELIATTTFGLEAVVKRELIDLGFEVLRTEDGKVTFAADASGLVRANLWLRTADRVLLKIGEFPAVTFDELFDRTRDLDWGRYLPADACFPVNGKSVKSTLFSISDSQAIVKKAIVESLKKRYNVSWFPETGAEYTIQISLHNDVATLTIDTSGTALHKRGYRIRPVAAPLKETLAAAMILLSYWRKDRVLYDVFCGSGTIVIEAAMIGRNIAPGLRRDFSSRHWPWIDSSVWETEIEKARRAIDRDAPIRMFASDLDRASIEAATENAKAAGVDDCITFSCRDFRDVEYQDEYGILITNPPYGERLTDHDDFQSLYEGMRPVFRKLTSWSIYVLTSYEGFANLFGRKPDRERKLYNGNIEVRYYQYYGPRPPRAVERGTESSR